MDETGIMAGMGINGLCVGSAETKTAIKKHPELESGLLLLSAFQPIIE
jgi:hypothetical protein